MTFLTRSVAILAYVSTLGIAAPVVPPVQDVVVVKRNILPDANSEKISSGPLWERAADESPSNSTELMDQTYEDDLERRASGKDGLAWLNGPKLSMFVQGSRPVKWCYTWSQWPCEPSGLGIESVPMLWGGGNKVGPFQSYVKAHPPKYVLGFNEPDWPSQANLSPNAAVDLWMKAINPLKAKKVSPATTGGPSGKKWLTKFMAICKTRGCKVDAIGAHFYGEKSADLIKYIKSLYDEHKKPIWVTEFACRNFGKGIYCSAAQAAKFNAEVIAFFESTGYIQRYAAFGALRSLGNVGEGPRLMNSAGNALTALGKAYIGL